MRSLQKSLALGIVSLSSIHTQAQVSIKGMAIDYLGNPTPYVSIHWEDRSQPDHKYAQTDSMGHFQIDNLIPSHLYRIVASKNNYYNTQIDSFITSDVQNNRLLIRMRAKDLSDVVVIGYGNQNRKAVSGAIASVSSSELIKNSVLNFDQALVGKMSGVQVIQNTGKPNAAVDIRVRGTGSITAGINPLYVIDGVPVSSGAQMNELVNIADIASIDVLKDASAAAIYGSRGANGVVIITTKKGISGKTNISYNGSYGIQQIAKEIPMLDAYQYAQLSYEGHNNAYLGDGASKLNNFSPKSSDAAILRPNSWDKIPTDLYSYIGLQDDGTPGGMITKGLTNTNWQKAIYQTAPMIKQSIVVAGGNEHSNFYISGNYEHQDGIIIHSDYSRYSTRINYNVSGKKIKLGVNIAPSYSIENRVNSDDYYGNYGIVQSALAMSPTWSVYNQDGSYNYDGNGKWRNGIDYQHNEIVNPVAIATLYKNKIRHANILTNISMDWTILPELHYKLNTAVTFNQYNADSYWPSTLPLIGVQYWAANSYIPSIATGNTSSTYYINWLVENMLTFHKKWQKHSLEILAGATAQKERMQQSVFSTSGAVNNAIQNAAASNTFLGTPTYTIQSWSLASLLSRAQYSFANKYFATASVRTDGSSRFGANHRWGYFPSISGAWLMSSEDFMKNLPVINLLKLRASYGISGNFNIGNYNQVDKLSNTIAILGTPQTSNTGVQATQPANPNLTWEKTKMINVGMDLGFWNNKLGLQFDVYNGNSFNSLLNLPVPTISGYATALQNIGQVNNKGLEIGITSNNHFGKLSWNGLYNISFNRNKVVALGQQNAPIIAQGPATSYWITEVGKPIGSYYLLQYEGIFTSANELAQKPHFPTTQIGDFKFKDVDNDGVMDVSKDRTIVGSYFPKFTYGFSNNFAYNGLDISFSFQGVYGNKILNLSRRYIANMEGNINNMAIATNRYVDAEHPGDGKTNRANRKATGNNSTISTWHLESGSYLRLQNITLGYSLPNAIAKRYKFTTLRFYVSAQNIFTFTHYSGYNPEINMNNSNQLTPGLDYGVYPLAKTFTFGLNLNF